MHETGGMKPPDPHYRHRFPAEIISHAVWLYDVFSLSLRDVELRFCRKFCSWLNPAEKIEQAYAANE